jgi:hypothetical protein
MWLVNTSAQLLTFFLLIEVETEFFIELNKVTIINIH